MNTLPVHCKLNNVQCPEYIHITWKTNVSSFRGFSALDMLTIFGCPGKRCLFTKADQVMLMDISDELVGVATLGKGRVATERNGARVVRIGNRYRVKKAAMSHERRCADNIKVSIMRWAEYNGLRIHNI